MCKKPFPSAGKSGKRSRSEMAHVEELPDDFDEALNLGEAPRVDGNDDAVFEEMYYNRFAKKGADKPETNPKSFEEVMLEFSKTPLFMNDLHDVANAGTRTRHRNMRSLQMLKSIFRR